MREKNSVTGGDDATNTIYQNQPADIFNKTTEKYTINYVKKAYSFIMNTVLIQQRQLDLFIVFVQTKINFTLAVKYDSKTISVLRG